MSPPQKWAPKQTPSGKREEEQEDWKSFFNLEDHEEGRPGGSAEQQQQQQSSQGPAVSSQSSPARRQAKKPRRSKNSPEPDYSAVVQNQMAGTNRTGQACDRCKVREFFSEPLPRDPMFGLFPARPSGARCQGRDLRRPCDKGP